MKKIVLSLSFIVAIAFSATAQDISNNAIGLRLDAGEGLGASISYQKKMSESNRLEVNLGLRDKFSSFKAVGLYEWVWNIEDKFNWYAGGGAGFDSGYSSLFAAGVIGIEYNFDLPILVSLDYTPKINLTGSTEIQYPSLAFSVRYQF